MAAYMRKTGILPVCTNDEARDYFAGKGLSYDDVTEGDILALGHAAEQAHQEGQRRLRDLDGLHVPKPPDRPQAEDQRRPDQLLPLRQQPLLRAPGVYQLQC